MKLQHIETTKKVSGANVHILLIEDNNNLTYAAYIKCRGGNRYLNNESINYSDKSMLLKDAHTFIDTYASELAQVRQKVKEFIKL